MVPENCEQTAEVWRFNALQSAKTASANLAVTREQTHAGARGRVATSKQKLPRLKRSLLLAASWGRRSWLRPLASLGFHFFVQTAPRVPELLLLSPQDQSELCSASSDSFLPPPPHTHLTS